MTIWFLNMYILFISQILRLPLGASTVLISASKADVAISPDRVVLLLIAISFFCYLSDPSPDEVTVSVLCQSDSFSVY